ncbi:MAG: GAF domain-containing SpoIIE family protein phosphatase [Chloroflexota bacterium]
MAENVLPTTPENLKPEHLRTLYQVSTWINSTLDFDEALDNAMTAIMQVTKAQRGFLLRVDESLIEEEGAEAMDILVAQGFDGEMKESERPSSTIVNQVVKTREPLLTNNAQFDDRIRPGQSIIMKGLRAILASPMLVQDRLIGVVYVDTSMKAGVFRPDDLSLLQAVSGVAARAIENARLYAVAREKGRLEQELRMAHDIQENLLPAEMPATPHYDIASYWQSAREVAGDFYDAFTMQDDTVGAVIADVSDKGAPAALFMAVARTLLRSHAHAGMTPVEAMSRTNDLIMEDAENSGMFVTMYYSRYKDDGSSQHVNGGHNPPIYYKHSTGSSELLPIGGRALGWFLNNPLKEIQIALEPGDAIVYYTDGLTEAENPRGEPYGEDRLISVVNRIGDHTSAELMDMILNDVDVFAEGEPPFDDMTMLIVRYNG